MQPVFVALPFHSVIFPMAKPLSPVYHFWLVVNGYSPFYLASVDPPTRPFPAFLVMAGKILMQIIFWVSFLVNVAVNSFVANNAFTRFLLQSSGYLFWRPTRLELEPDILLQPFGTGNFRVGIDFRFSSPGFMLSVNGHIVFTFEAIPF